MGEQKEVEITSHAHKNNESLAKMQYFLKKNMKNFQKQQTN